MTDDGAIQTGRAHPHRKSISQPYSPVPATSNAGKDANEDLYRRSASPLRSPGPLHDQPFIEDKDPTNDEGQDNTMGHKNWN